MVTPPSCGFLQAFHPAFMTQLQVPSLASGAGPHLVWTKHSWKSRFLVGAFMSSGSGKEQTGVYRDFTHFWCALALSFWDL